MALLNISLSAETANGSRCVARNSQWEGCLGGLGAEPPAAGGQWGSEGKAPSHRRLEVWGQTCSKILHLFAKITSF